VTGPSFGRNLRGRRVRGTLFAVACLGACLVGVVMLGLLLFGVFRDGWSRLDWDFVTSFPSRKAEKAGIKAALFGSLWLLGLTTLICVPLGVAAALYLEEYAKKTRLTEILEVNIANLAGVPSIVYGLLGLALFVRALGFGPTVLSGSLTLSLLTLPTIILASREAIRAVPRSLRLAALAVGATRWQTTRHHVLPAALPGILTGIILSISRAIGESAPLIMMGALTYVAFVPKHPLEGFTVLPIQVFNWASRPQAAFKANAAAGIIVLLAVLLSLNAVAIVIRNRFQRFKR
jgi:phosphate transport system permease protein